MLTSARIEAEPLHGYAHFFLMQLQVLGKKLPVDQEMPMRTFSQRQCRLEKRLGSRDDEQRQERQANEFLVAVLPKMGLCA